MLSNALPEEKQRISFMNALGNFKGSDFREFWNKHLPTQPEFKDNPELVSGLQLTQQLTLLTGNHQSLVKELQVNRKLTSIHQLMELEKSEWQGIIRKSGVPDFIDGQNDEEKIDRYADLMQSLLNATFPTQRIAKMVEKNQLSIEKASVLKSLGTFLSKNERFDFASSRIHDFDKEIKEAAGKDFDEVRSELMKIQRVFQVSTSPEAMSVLIKNNLHSASTIVNIPRKSFIKTYGKALGGEQVAFAIHQRASHISIKAKERPRVWNEKLECSICGKNDFKNKLSYSRHMGAHKKKGEDTTIGLPGLRAGSNITIDGLGEPFSGGYFVTGTTHSISDSGYTTRFSVRREET